MRSVLITGGSGFLGQHLARELIKTYDRVCIYSRSEHAQANMREAFNDDPRLRWFIGDVRDKERLCLAAQGCDSVIGAAALKRIEVGYYNPFEMVKTNVNGTQNTIEAAVQGGAKNFVFVSSDKATNPKSCYGYTKALGESLTLNANHVYGHRGPKFKIVKYGNIAGSAGSCIPKWRDMLKTSSTVPVTDPEATRFWMYIDDAVELILSALEDDAPPISIPVLPAYRVGDLAEAMGAKINVIGLPDYEKLHEEMREGEPSNLARRLSVEELHGMLSLI